MAITTNSPPVRRSRTKGNRPRRSLLLVVLIVALAIGIVGGGFVIGSHLVSAPSSTERGPSTQPTAAPPSPIALAPGTPPAAGSEPFAAAFASLAAELEAKVGIVVRPLGAGPVSVTAGEWSTGIAWSTIKVPLAIAGLRAPDSPGVTEAMRAAITQSDNDAAESIWAGLGDPAVAAQKVEAVLADAGAPAVVESQKLRTEFTAFGQTTWSLNDQATFLSSAACDPRNQPIMDLMGQIAPDQSWGLGQIPGAEFKGGWGPSPAGNYLVRQFGVIPVNDGLAVVAVAVEPNSGAFEDGTQELSRIAVWLQERADLLPVGRC
ncbi:hypothetical protein AB4Z42_02080 [Mycobacterium sp. 2YAF39]|uniref:hypothetical protein n=1 Tax=Mycobacterium sp. 2YAF39 TaxID=3233033 RepID=UPI003F9860E4